MTQDRAPLDSFDVGGKQLEDWADDSSLFIDFLRVVEVAFGTIGMTILTVVLALGLLLRRHRWAALLVVVVMVVTSLATSALKIWLGRDRPEWQDNLGLLNSFSFPSGHASSSAAYAALLVMLLVLFVRRTSLRRLGIALVVGVVAAGLPGPGAPGPALPHRRDRRLAAGRRRVLPRPRLHRPAAALDRGEVGAAPGGLRLGERLAVILNPIKVEDVGQFRSLVASMAMESGWSEPTWQYTTVEDPGTGMAEKAAVSGADLVIVCGGDGTVREVCAELAGTGIPVGIIPAGTGNLLARNLGIPLYIRSAIDIALNGQDRAIDMVEVGGDGIEDTHFMVMAGMGFDAAIMEGVNEDIKKKIGWVAYVISGLKSLMFPAVRVEIQIDDEEPTRPPGPHGPGRQRRLPPGRHAAAARRDHRRRRPRRGDPAPPQVPVVDPAGRARAARRARPSTSSSTAAPGRGCGSRPPPTPPASSTATPSARAASCGWSASTGGCWSASRADRSGQRTGSPSPAR